MNEYNKLEMSFDYFWDIDVVKLREEMQGKSGELTTEEKRALERLEDMVTVFDDVHYEIMQAVKE